MRRCLTLILCAAVISEGHQRNLLYNRSAATDETRFLFWKDYPGSDEYKAQNPSWYDTLSTRAGDSFETSKGFFQDKIRIEVNWNNQKALHLWSDPSFAKKMDDSIRDRNGPQSSTLSGTIDSCGWPDKRPDEATSTQQYSRRTTPYEDDFSNGLDPESLVVMLDKGCCSKNLTDNVDIVRDKVDGVEKAVLRLRAYNEDYGCPGPACKKKVNNTGVVATADLFGSGRYEVKAKVPKASGMVWAIWTFHGEVHGPKQCSQYSCYCGDGGAAGCSSFPNSTCMPKSHYSGAGCPKPGPCGVPSSECDGWDGPGVPQTCAASHTTDDPQFLGSLSSTGYQSHRNDEIDIEIPANCIGTSNVCPNKTDGCAGDYSTANLNNYLYTNGGGGGDQYANMCVKASKLGMGGQVSPMALLGDGEYHTYAFEWHTGDSAKEGSSYVDFFIDDIYFGTNNAFVPTRAGRFWMALWEGAWNGNVDGWGGGTPGDGLVYTQTTLISHVKVTPFNEPNDIIYPSFIDQPDGCVPSAYAPDWWGCNQWRKHRVKVL